EVMGLSEEEAQDKFGFLLDAFQYGPPPHGGVAFGWDRIVMLLAGAESLREVIAFPQTGGGCDPLTGAPAPITAQQRKEAGGDATTLRHATREPGVAPLRGRCQPIACGGVLASTSRVGHDDSGCLLHRRIVGRCGSRTVSGRHRGGDR